VIRRQFIALLGGAAAAWPFVASAQQSARLRTIGYLGSSTALAQSSWVAAFVRRLHELGWLEGQTVAIEYRWAEGRSERFAEIAAEFVRLKVDVIVTAGTAPALAAKQANRRSQSCFLSLATRSATALWQACRVPVQTLPACRCKRLW
jgi:putative ABC transport system substrate-binding protein